MQDYTAKRKLAPKFQETFGVPLSAYFDNIFGLDIVRLDDEVIKARDNKSIEDAIVRQYSREAADLIWELL